MPVPASSLFDLLTTPPPQSTALVMDDQRYRFADLRDAAARVAAAFAQHGIGRGDVVAVMLPNGLFWLAAHFGAALRGAAVLSLNIRLGPKEAGELIHRARAKALLYDGEALEHGCAATVSAIGAEKLSSVAVAFVARRTARASAPITPTIDLEDVLAQRGDPPSLSDVQTATGDDPCLILATSGTTGQPKLVVHGQQRVLTRARAIASHLGLSGEGVIPCVILPFCGAFGFTMIMSALASGRPTVIADGFDPARTGDLLVRHDVTFLGGTNDMLLNLLRHAAGEATPFPALRFYVHANFTPSLTQMPVEAARRGVTIRGAYGLSELLALTAIQPVDAPLEQRSEGGGILVDPGAVVRIADPVTDAAVPDGVVGEIQVRSPNAMLGYLDDPHATAAAMTDDGFFKTGDLGYRLADGALVFTARANDALRIGGYLVSPLEIEEVVAALPGVTACQVVAVRGPSGSPRPVAFVTGNGPPIGEDAVIAHCASHLAKYKVPIRVIALDRFPQTDGPNGAKVKKAALRKLAEDALHAPA